MAGLVPGASEGKGRGNAFLADLSNCDALIQVIDLQHRPILKVILDSRQMMLVRQQNLFRMRLIS